MMSSSCCVVVANRGWGLLMLLCVIGVLEFASGDRSIGRSAGE